MVSEILSVPSAVAIMSALQVVEMASDNNYLHRISVLYCLRDLCATVSTSETSSRIVPAFVKAAKDAVPNIRFVTAKILQALHPSLQGSNAQNAIITCLQTLTDDPDTDVRFYARRALAKYQENVPMAESS
jgi:serine/threonine-protein phosphatase 2A regulatory subunit A